MDICGLSLDGWTGLKTGPYRRWESANVWLTVYPLPPLFSDLRILEDFKCFVFGSADSRGVTGAFFGSADSTGLTTFRTFGRGKSQDQDQARDVRIDNCDNTKQSNMLVMKCQGPKWENERKTTGVPSKNLPELQMERTTVSGR